MSQKRLYIAVGAVLFITCIAQAWERSVYAIFPLIASIALWSYARKLEYSFVEPCGGLSIKGLAGHLGMTGRGPFLVSFCDPSRLV